MAAFAQAQSTALVDEFGAYASAQTSATGSLATGITMAILAQASGMGTASLLLGGHDFYATAGAQATASGALVNQIRLVALGSSAASCTVALHTGIVLQAAPSSLASSTSALGTAIRLAASVGAVGTGTGSFKIGDHFASQSQAGATASAGLSTGILMAAHPQAVASATSAIVATIRMAAQAAAQTGTQVNLKCGAHFINQLAPAQAAVVASLFVYVEIDGATSASASASGWIFKGYPGPATRDRLVLVEPENRMTLAAYEPRSQMVLPENRAAVATAICKENVA
jgi:hypothetical protein